MGAGITIQFSRSLQFIKDHKEKPSFSTVHGRRLMQPISPEDEPLVVTRTSLEEQGRKVLLLWTYDGPTGRGDH